MRLLFVITSLNHGGAETQLLRMIQYFIQHSDYEIKVVVMVSPNYSKFKDQIIMSGIEYTDLGAARGKFTLKNLVDFLKVIKAFKPDVVHSHMIHANLLARFSRLFVRIPFLVNTIHGEEELIGKRVLAYKLTDKLCNITTAVSEVILDQAVKRGAVDKKKIKILYNALDIIHYQPDPTLKHQLREEFKISREAFVWIIVGRLDAVKNHELLIQAMSILNHKGKFPYLIVLGDGVLRGHLEEMVENKLLVKDKIIFCGNCENVHEVLNIADAFVLSSNNEGLPLVLQEAAALELPIVSTDVGGCNEVVINNKNGLLVRKESSSNLAEAMECIMKLSAEERIQMGHISRKIAIEKFDIRNVMSEWIALYGRN